MEIGIPLCSGKINSCTKAQGHNKNCNPSLGFQTCLENFVEIAQNVVNQNWDDMGYSKNLEAMPYPVIAYVEPKQNTRYVKITIDSLHQMSVYCFIDSTNGDILKAASWKAPAKTARGNIYDEDSILAGITPYGAAYLL